MAPAHGHCRDAAPLSGVEARSRRSNRADPAPASPTEPATRDDLRETRRDAPQCLPGAPPRAARGARNATATPIRSPRTGRERQQGPHTTACRGWAHFWRRIARRKRAHTRHSHARDLRESRHALILPASSTSSPSSHYYRLGCHEARPRTLPQPRIELVVLSHQGPYSTGSEVGSPPPTHLRVDVRKYKSKPIDCPPTERWRRNL